MEQLTVRLERKLEQESDNPEGWAMLARSYKSLGRWDDAERAFGRIGPTFEQNAELLAEYAEILVQRDSGFGEQARAKIRKSLEIDPHNMLALFLGGGEAFENGRYTEAITLWERLLPQLQAGSDDAQMVEAGIARARDRAGRTSSAAPRNAVPGAAGRKAQDTAKTPVASAKTSIRGRVELSPALKGKVEPNDTVFIFARAIDGPRMPLAALRARAADLPIDFSLDDSQALSADARLSTATQVHVEVRVSKSGNAMPGKGDLAGSSGPVKPGATDLRIKIDKITP
jgi:cytochrome c-type biogenesis protein CcmH